MSTVVNKTSQGTLKAGKAAVGLIVLVGGTTDSTCSITDAIIADETEVISLKAKAGTTAKLPFSGWDFSTGVYLQAITGTAAKVYVELV